MCVCGENTAYFVHSPRLKDGTDVFFLCFVDSEDGLSLNSPRSPYIAAGLSTALQVRSCTLARVEPRSERLSPCHNLAGKTGGLVTGTF